MKRRSVFISYSTRYRYVSHKVEDFLKSRGWPEESIFWDKKLSATKIWNDEIKEAIRTKDTFLYLLTPESIKSSYCQNEYNYAVSNAKIFVPILVHPDAKIICPAQILEQQLIDFTTPDIEQEEKKLLDALESENPYQLTPDKAIDSIWMFYHLDKIIEDLEELTYAACRDACELSVEDYVLKKYRSKYEEATRFLEYIYIPNHKRAFIAEIKNDLAAHIQHIGGYGLTREVKLKEHVIVSSRKLLKILSQWRWQ